MMALVQSGSDTISFQDNLRQMCYNRFMESNSRHRRVSSRVIRPGVRIPADWEWEGYTPEERIAAVWELTLLCLAWGNDDGEPRLQRSDSRVQRPRG